MTYSRFLIVLASLCMAIPCQAFDVNRPSVQDFIYKMVKNYHFQQSYLSHLIATEQPDPHVIQAITHPAESLPWYKYRSIFLTSGRIRAGRQFVRLHHKLLAQVAARYGVPPAIIAAIVGMESYYGKYEGNYSALRVLSTLAFDYPPRSTFFSKELSAYLLLCRNNHFLPNHLKSSYAGALGAGQFMPSTYLTYAINADGSSTNLFTDWPDIVASVANYLNRNGWSRGHAIAVPAAVPKSHLQPNLLDRLTTAGHLRTEHVLFVAPVNDQTPVVLFSTQTKTGSRYWVGLPNFQAILHYNASTLYALAATELAAAISSPSPSDHTQGNRKKRADR